MRYLYIDDEHTPKTDLPWHITRSYEDATNFIRENSIPSCIFNFYSSVQIMYVTYTYIKLVEDTLWRMAKDDYTPSRGKNKGWKCQHVI